MLNKNKKKNKKVFVLGLDCATPQLIFDQYLDELPHIRALMENGKYGLLESACPPVTVPAWMSMFTGKDPGQMGFYGFTDRHSYAYDDSYIVNSNVLKDKTIWDYLGEKGLKSIVLGVPQTYPPKRLNGILVASFLTPDKSLPYTYPKEIKNEIETITNGNYIIDIENFRTKNKEKLLEQIYEMTEKRFKIIKSFIKNKKWDLFIAVEMGIDRLHHAFWQFCFSDHPLYKKNNPFQSAIKDYYKFIDQELGQIIKLLDNDTSLMIVSDHGAQILKGKFCLNEWLIKKGYLVLKHRIKESINLRSDQIDWSKTKAWAKGGYYGRIFFNIIDREPQGIIPKNKVNEVRNELIKKLSAVAMGENKINNQIYSPEEIYQEVNNRPPDLILYCNKLSWRIDDSIGNKEMFLLPEKESVDNANHDINGIFIGCKNPKAAVAENINMQASPDNYTLLDITPTLLDFFNIKIPQDLSGKIINI